VRYQFTIDGRAFGSKIRRTWQEAAQDAVNAGFAGELKRRDKLPPAPQVMGPRA